MTTGKSISVQADIFWACTQHPNPSADKEQYTVNLCNLSDKAVAALESMGVIVHSDAVKRPTEGHYITCKSNYKIDAFDIKNELINPNIKIANGSKATAILSSYEWTFKNKKGVSPSLKKLVITNLIEYNGIKEEDMEEEVL